MIPPPPDQDMLETSTPIRCGSRSWAHALPMSPVYAQKLRTLNRWSDSGFLGSSPEDRQPSPLYFLRKEVFFCLQKIFHHTPVRGEQSPEVIEKKKRIFLEAFRCRLFVRPSPSRGQVSMRDVCNVLNACGRQFGIQFTTRDAHSVYSSVRSFQECSVKSLKVCGPVVESAFCAIDYPFVKVDDNKSRGMSSLYPNALFPPRSFYNKKVSKVCDNESRGMSPEYENALFRPRSFYNNEVSRNEDSGVEVSFGDSSLSFGSDVGDSSPSFYAPIVPQQYDFLKELNKMNCYEITSKLMSYLSPKDLQTVSSVSTLYRSIVLNDTQVNQRRRRYLMERRLTKENKHVVKSKETNEDRVQFQDLANKLKTLPKQPLANQSSKTIYDSFVEVGKNLHRSDILLKCPNCQYPSKRINGRRYCCTRQFCSYEFCCDCAGPYLGNHKCQKFHRVEDVPKIVVGSLKSKRNLRRL